MAQDHGLCRKEKKQSTNGTGARAATAGPCCSCQRDSLAACKHVDFYSLDDPGAHGRNRAKQNERGKTNLNGDKMLMRAVGMAGKE